MAIRDQVTLAAAIKIGRYLRVDNEDWNRPGGDKNRGHSPG